MVATRVTLIVLAAIFAIGVIAEKNGKAANRMLAGTAICIAGLVALQIFT